MPTLSPLAGTAVQQQVKNRVLTSATERRSVPSLYIRAESLSPMDLSLVLLSPTPCWDLQTASLCPPHLPSLWSKGFPEIFVLSLPVTSSLSLLDARASTLYLTCCRDKLKTSARSTVWLFFFLLEKRLKMPEPTKKGTSADSEDEQDPCSSNGACKSICMYFGPI